VNALVCRDVFGYSLRYYSGDYVAASRPAAADGFDMVQSGSAFTSPSLYNGNITGMVTAIGKFMEGSAGPLGKSYYYDQLNRLVESRTFVGADKENNTWVGASESGDYRTRYSYDANGNILTLDRHGANAVNLDMDSLVYHYYANTNRLEYVTDHVNSANYGNDVDDQSAGNYEYDAIGNLVKDVAEEIEEIEWNVYGKVTAVIRTSESDKPSLYFEYSPEGYRTVKTVVSAEGEVSKTYYVRDAMGNVMATYDVVASRVLDTAELSWEELNSRLVNGGGLQQFADFLVDELDIQTLVGTVVDDMEGEIVGQSKQTELLYWYNPTDILVNDAGHFANVLNGFGAGNLVDAIVSTHIGGIEDIVGFLCGYDDVNFITHCYTSDRYHYLRSLDDFNTFEFNSLYSALTTTPPAPPSHASLNDKINWLMSNVSDVDIVNRIIFQGGCALNDNVLVESQKYNVLYYDLLMNWADIEAAAEWYYGQNSLSLMMVTHNRPLVWDILIANSGTSGFMADYKTEDVNLYLKNMIKTLPYEVGTEIMNQTGFTKLEYLDEVREFYGQGFYDSLMFGLIMDYYKLVSYYKLAEHHIYGSSRLGTREVKLRLLKLDDEGEVEERFGETQEDLYFYRGYKRYEMSNHLGNVLVVVSDKRTPICDGGVSHFEAEVLAAQDYAPFGMLLPERTWTSDSVSYRYSFNGYEKLDELYGEGNGVDFGERIYDSRLGRFLSLDPLMDEFPEQSPFVFADNSPIINIDLDGESAENVNENIGQGDSRSSDTKERKLYDFDIGSKDNKSNNSDASFKNLGNQEAPNRTRSQKLGYFISDLFKTKTKEWDFVMRRKDVFIIGPNETVNFYSVWRGGKLKVRRIKGNDNREGKGLEYRNGDDTYPIISRYMRFKIKRNPRYIKPNGRHYFTNYSQNTYKLKHIYYEGLRIETKLLWGFIPVRFKRVGKWRRIDNLNQRRYDRVDRRGLLDTRDHPSPIIR